MTSSKVPQVLPPGTTHFCPAFGRYPTRAFKLKSCDEWAYWTGFDWQGMRCRPVPSVCREMIDVRPKVTGPSIAELIEQGFIKPLPFKCTAAPVAPFTWNGPEDGLPPVGLEIEVLWSSTKREYVTGKVLAHDEDRAIFRFTSGERKGEYQADKPHSQHGADLPNFRPIRTAEQLAAEEREQQVEQMQKLVNSTPIGYKAGLYALYDAGYRKVEQP